MPVRKKSTKSPPPLDCLCKSQDSFAFRITIDQYATSQKYKQAETLKFSLWLSRSRRKSSSPSVPIGETPVSGTSGKRFHYACPLPAPPKFPCVLALLSLLSTSAASRRTLCTSMALSGCSPLVRFAGDNGRTCCCC
jgi:hypothetical protein